MSSYNLRQKNKSLGIVIALEFVVSSELVYCSHFPYESRNYHSYCPTFFTKHEQTDKNTK